MSSRVKIAFFGSSLLSSSWNGAATYYRGLIRALHQRGYDVTFYEPDANGRQRHRDLEDPPWAEVVVYPAQEGAALGCVARARSADLVVKAGGVGVFDQLLERAVLDLRRPGGLVAFWDVDAPATLDRVRGDPADPFARLIPRYDLVLTRGGGDPVVRAYRALGARECVPIHDAFDPSTHHPVPPEPRFEADLVFLGNRLPDREARVEELFLRAAAMRPGKRFLLGGSGWGGKPLPPNVRQLGQVPMGDHNALHCTPLAVLDVSRERMFEAAGAAACLIADAWEGIEQLFDPGEELLVARSGAEVAERLAALTPEESRRIGRRAYRRALATHTYSHRAGQVDALLRGRIAPRAGPHPPPREEAAP